MTDTILKILYREAYGFLMNNTERKFMENQLMCTKSIKAKNLKEVYRCLLDALIFTRRMKEIIGPVESLEQSLYGFDPIKIYSHYGDNWEKMCDDLAKGTNHVMHWQSFCRGAVSGASFLNQLSSIDKFHAFINSFQNNEMATAVLPLLFQKVVHGLSFPMACVFLYGVGYTDYISPDPKVKALLKDIGITESMDNYEALKTLVLIARINQKPMPYVHNLFWLIGNGTLSKGGNKDQRYRKEFVGHIIPILHCFNYHPQQIQT